MSYSRDNPLARVSAFVWGIGAFLVFVIGLGLIYLINRQDPSTLEDLAARDRYETKAAVFAAQDAALGYKETEPGVKVQVPPHDVYEYVGGKLVAAKPVAIEKPEQRGPWAGPPPALTEGIDFAAVNASGPKADDPIDPAVMEKGKAVYMLCAACHGQNGEGGPAGPPHAGSEWVTGPVSNLIRIQMRGLEGPITVKGEVFNAVPMMTPFAFQSDEDIAAVLTYIRNSFGNKASAVSPEQVKAIRPEAGQPFLKEADLIKP